MDANDDTELERRGSGPEMRFRLWRIWDDGTRETVGWFATRAEAIDAFNADRETQLRGRIEDTADDREYWLFPVPPQRKKGEPKATPPKVMITAWGETKNLLAWGRDPRCQCSFKVIQQRLARTERIWSPEEAISTPPKKGILVAEDKQANAKRYSGFGEEKTLREWLEDPRCNADRAWLRELLLRGASIEEALLGGAPVRVDGRARSVVAWGETKMIRDWAKDPRCQVNELSLRNALKRGVQPEEAIQGLWTKKKSGPKPGTRRSRVTDKPEMASE